MGWFDQQIRERKQSDREIIEDSLLQMAGAVMGRRLTDALNDDRMVTRGALEEVLKYYHLKMREIPDGMQDVEEALDYLLRPYGYMHRHVELRDTWYRDAFGAMIGIRKSDGSVVSLIPKKLFGYTMLDLTTGKRVTIDRRNAADIDVEAVAIYKAYPEKKMGVLDLFRYIMSLIQPGDWVMYALALLCATLLGLLMPKLTQMLFADVAVYGNTRMLLSLGVFMICISVSSLLFQSIQTMTQSRISTKIGFQVESATMMRILSLPANFFRDYSAGELANRSSYMNTLSNQIISLMVTTGLGGIFSLLYVTQIFAYAPTLVTTTFVIIFSTMAISMIQVLWQTRITRQSMQMQSKVSGFVFSILNGIQKIKLAGAEKRAFAKWGEQYARQAALQYDPPLLLKVYPVLTQAIGTIGSIVLYFQAARAGLSVADYYAFTVAYGMLFAALTQLTTIAGSAAQIRPILEMAEPIMKTEPEITHDREIVTKLSGSIELNNVSFRYREDMPLILDNLSLKIRPGEYVAIVGKTGCGKSTLMRILLGFEKPQKGAVYYDGKDLSRLDPKSVRRCIGTVIQNGELFTGSIYDNIVVSAPWLSLVEAEEAAEMAGMKEDIEHMPMGMQTMVMEGGGGISGGQRQRIMIARAIAPKPKILMFDEATSALDNITQKQVSDALDGLKCTRLVIAHRLSTIRNCNRIIVLDQGHIIENGTYDELMAKNGFFAELVSRQLHEG